METGSPIGGAESCTRLSFAFHWISLPETGSNPARSISMASGWIPRWASKMKRCHHHVIWRNENVLGLHRRALWPPFPPTVTGAAFDTNYFMPFLVSQQLYQLPYKHDLSNAGCRLRGSAKKAFYAGDCILFHRYVCLFPLGCLN